MKEFEAKVIESSKELSARERIIMKDTSDAIQLDEATRGEEKLYIKVKAYVVLQVHNEKSEDKDYKKYVLVDENGNKYVTGSTSFWRQFSDIYEEMSDEGLEDDITIHVYRKPSKNYKDKDFLTCSLC